MFEKAPTLKKTVVENDDRIIPEAKKEEDNSENIEHNVDQENKISKKEEIDEKEVRLNGARDELAQKAIELRKLGIADVYKNIEFLQIFEKYKEQVSKKINEITASKEGELAVLSENVSKGLDEMKEKMKKIGFSDKEIERKLKKIESKEQKRVEGVKREVVMLKSSAIDTETRRYFNAEIEGAQNQKGLINKARNFWREFTLKYPVMAITVGSTVAIGGSLAFGWMVPPMVIGAGAWYFGTMHYLKTFAKFEKKLYNETK